LRRAASAGEAQQGPAADEFAVRQVALRGCLHPRAPRRAPACSRLHPRLRRRPWPRSGATSRPARGRSGGWRTSSVCG
jgi:hypothetical protein